VSGSLEGRIKAVLYGMLVSGTGTALSIWVETQRSVVSSIRGSLVDAGLAVESSFGSAASALMSVNLTFRSLFIDVGLSAGVASPVAVAVLTVVSMGVLAGVLAGIGFIIRLILPP